MSCPSLSIVLPVYNGEKYLRESIDSVLAQDYGEFEMIIWDDRSTDSSSEIIAGYQDQRIRFYENSSNQGLFKTLNLAIGKAHGDLIRLWSQDDAMKPHCLGTEIEFHLLHPEVGMGYCLYDTIDEEGAVILAAREHQETPAIISPEMAAMIMFYHGSITGNIANVMLKRAALDEVGLFREDMRIAGDFEMWERISARYPLGFLHDSLIRLRSHQGQFSRQRYSYVVAMSEEQSIYENLMKRLPPDDMNHAVKYDRRNRYVPYVHHMIRCLLRGDLRVAARTYQEIKRAGHPTTLIGLWFLTANRRFFQLESRFLQRQPSSSL